MLSQICESYPFLEVHFLYSTKLPHVNATSNEVLFLSRILYLLSVRKAFTTLELYFTGTWDDSALSDKTEMIWSLSQGQSSLPVKVHTKRIEEVDILHAIGSHSERASSVFYVCGPPQLTDSTVEYLRAQGPIAPERVICEKWW